jgi:hypothetical protein
MLAKKVTKYQAPLSASLFRSAGPPETTTQSHYNHPTTTLSPLSGHPSLLWLDLIRHIEPSEALNATAGQEKRRTR